MGSRVSNAASVRDPEEIQPLEVLESEEDYLGKIKPAVLLGGLKHVFVPGESASCGDKHHHFMQERAGLAQGLSS